MAPNPTAPHGDAPAPSSGPVDAARVRTLVVDDNVDAADTFGLLLETLGCDVRTAYTGTSALAMGRTFLPQLVFLDLGLPDISGLDVCERLRAEPGGRAVVICAVTGWGRAADRAASASAGFDHHLVKPVEPDRLTPLVAEAGARVRAAGAPEPDPASSAT